jgi:hypothetical protein
LLPLQGLFIDTPNHPSSRKTYKASIRLGPETPPVFPSTVPNVVACIPDSCQKERPTQAEANQTKHYTCSHHHRFQKIYMNMEYVQ